jgi:hypothetical protein
MVVECGAMLARGGDNVASAAVEKLCRTATTTATRRA